MVDKNLFRGKMISLGYTQSTLAKAMGIGYSSLNAKINNRRSFDTDEILRACALLGITEDGEKVAIFLSPISQSGDELPTKAS